MPVSVYAGADSYLRIGPQECISKEVAYHKKLAACGFPVARILEEGEFESEYYFVESSLGDKHFSQIFKATLSDDGGVSDSDFVALVALVKKYAEAQLKGVTSETFSAEEFEKVILYNSILDEKPALREKTIAAMKKVEARIGTLPLVLSHGDFNPSNILEGGVIDWERGRALSLGYDLTTCISQIFFFPLSGDFEFTGVYRYSREQVTTYWEAIDALYLKHGFPKISEYKNDFIICRSMWSAARMDDVPKIQKWRYDQYEKLLDAYLRGDDCMEFLYTYHSAS